MCIIIMCNIELINKICLYKKKRKKEKEKKKELKLTALYSVSAVWMIVAIYYLICLCPEYS